MPALSVANGYLWKCWRDTRSTFLIILSAVLVVGAFGVYVAFDPFGWIAAKPVDLQVQWQIAPQALLGTMLLSLPFAGMVLGALGVGTEFERGTADFLLTRPRSRRHLLWTSWALGAAQMALLVLVSNLFRLAPVGPGRFGEGSLRNFLRPPTVHRSVTLSHRYPVGSFEDFLGPVLVLCTMALVFYSLTYLMTTLARSGRNGTGLALGVMIAYGSVFATLRNWYDIRIPFFPVDLIQLAFPAFDSASMAIVAGWLAVCVALTLVAQLSFERAEI